MVSNKRQREDGSDKNQYSATNIATWLAEIENNSDVLNPKTHENLFYNIADEIRKWDKIQLLGMESQARQTICSLAKMVTKFKTAEINLAVNQLMHYGCPGETLGAIIDIMQHCSHDELLSIEQNAPGTIKAIVMANSIECNTLTPISKQLKKMEHQALLAIEQASKGTIKALAASVDSGSSDGLDAISEQLKSFTKSQLLEINRGCNETISQIALAAYCDYPEALQAIATQLSELTATEIVGLSRNYTILSISKAACKGYPEALNAISIPLGELTKEQIKSVYNSWPNNNVTSNTIMIIMIACSHGHDSAMRSIMAKFSGNSLENFDLKKSLQDLVSIVVKKFTCGKNLALIRVLSDLNWRHLVNDEKMMSWYDYIIPCLQAKKVKSYEDVLYFIKSEVLTCGIQEKENKLFFLKQLINYCKSILKTNDSDAMHMNRFIERLEKYINYYCQYLPKYLPISTPDLEIQSMLLPIVSRPGLFNTVRQQISTRYKSLQVLSAGIGTYIQAEPGRSLASAQDTVRQLFHNWLHKILCHPDQTLVISEQEKYGLQSMDIDFDDIHTLLKTYDFDGAIQFLKNQINSQAGVAMISDESDTIPQQTLMIG